MKKVLYWILGIFGVIAVIFIAIPVIVISYHWDDIVISEPQNTKSESSEPAIFHFEIWTGGESEKYSMPARGFLFSCPRWLNHFVEEKPAYMLMLDQMRCEEPDGTVVVWSDIDIRNEWMKNQ